MNLKFQILQKNDRCVVHVELGKHDDYVYRWHNAAINLGIIYALDNMLHPAICRCILLSGGKVKLKSRWCHEFCMNAGLHKRKYIELQFTTWELQESIEAGNTKVEYWINDIQVHQAWRTLPQRDGKTTRDMLVVGKALHKPNKHGCNKDWRYYTAAGYVPLCCMCNENDKLILE